MKRLALIALSALLAACMPDGGDGPRVFNDAGRNEAEGEFIALAAQDDGKVLATLPKAGDDGVVLRAIHSTGLTAGLGSNPVGLDRGFADEGRIVAFRRVGRKLVIEKENWTYRASADHPLEKAAVAQSFARSFLWAGDIAEENPDGSFTADISGFLTSDVMNIKGQLRASGQGDYAVDAARSFVDPKGVLAFPDNVEIDSYLTFAGDKAGREVAATAADGRGFTLIAHHSFVRLPEDGFRPRESDPRAGGIDMAFYDFSAALDQPIIRRFARRFRLERVDPSAKSGPVKNPIVFYVDPGAPEQIRKALVEGASWWGDAFEAAGFEDAYRVELLPEGAHPMDVRYNVIQWVHRQTRGWSYGGGVYDPRTGEMLKAHVVLGSQRVRQDRMIFEGLAGAEKSGTGSADDPVQLSLARIRQLSAHEVGHTLGFGHNFAASVNNRASVMDYPAPYVRPTAAGALDFSGAYSAGIGAWDKVALNWLYSQYPDGADEKAALNKIIADAYGSGLLFVDDPQGRPVSGAHPAASVWDNGDDAVAALTETMRVRQIALANFGPHVLKPGRAISDLRQVIVPIYLYHRYQIDAAAKLIGGYDFRYAVNGDGPAAGAPVPAARQRAALEALVATLDPAALDLPDQTLNLLNPQVDGGEDGEVFASSGGPMFSIENAADAAASETLQALLHPQRAARLIEAQRRNGAALSFESVLAAIDNRVFAPAPAPRQAEIARTLQTRFVSTLIDLATGEAAGGESQAPSVFLAFGPGGSASPAVAARTDNYLRALRGRLQPAIFESGDAASRAHRAFLAAKIDAHLNRPAPAARPSATAADIPPGSPIGMTMMEECWFCDLSQ